MGSNSTVPIQSLKLRPIVWIGGWSFDPAVHPFRESSSRHRSFSVIAVNTAQCRSAEEFRAVAEGAVWHAASRYGELSLAGWSMGSLLALELAARYPQLIRRMVLIGATPRLTQAPESDWPHGFPASRLKAMKRLLPRNRRNVLEDFHQLTLASSSPAGDGALADNFTPGESPWSTGALAAGLDYLLSADARALVGDVDVPTMLVHGTDDPICPVAGGRWVAGRLPKATWIEVHGAGHAPLGCRASSLYQRVEEFLVQP